MFQHHFQLYSPGVLISLFTYICLHCIKCTRERCCCVLLVTRITRFSCMFCSHTIQKSFVELKSLVDYTNRREFGKTACHEHQSVSDKLTAQRSTKALIADTPVNCRSVYLLRLNCSGRLVAAAHGDRSVCVYCASTGRLLLKCIGHEKSPWTLTVSHTFNKYCLIGTGFWVNVSV